MGLPQDEVLHRFVDHAMGDPDLSCYEAGFVSSMKYVVRDIRDRSLTMRQAAVILDISSKTGFRSAKPPSRATVDEDGFPVGYFDGLFESQDDAPVDDDDDEG